jgi:hypothetical protein
MFEVKKWTPDLDLTDFYADAQARGFSNNASKQMLVDSIAREKEWCVWILYHSGVAVGSVGAHSFPEMGNNAYRIAVRTCVFTDKLAGAYGNALRTKSVITENQNPTAQFLIPTCIEWCPQDSKLYITSNNSSIGTQRRVHTIFGPLMEQHGMMRRVKEIEYRGHVQTVWELFPTKFYQTLNRYPRWQ